MTRLFEQMDLTKRLESLQQGSTPLSQDGKYFAGTVTVVSPKPKTQSDAYAEKASKLRPTLLPVEVLVEGSRAMEFGAKKYGADQWREADLTARDFVDALMRHLIAYQQGEKAAPDSGVSHLGHIIANCGILLARFENDR